MRIRLLLIGLLLATVSIAPAAAQTEKNKPKPPKAKAEGHGKAAVPATDVEIRIIRDYYVANNPRPKPLPPGIAKNLARGKPLPPGIAKTRLPDPLLVKLPARPNYQWIMAGDVVVLVDPVGVVVDILRGIF